jgi:hypothetical protein
MHSRVREPIDSSFKRYASCADDQTFNAKRLKLLKRDSMMRGKRRLFLQEAVSTAELYVLYTQKQRRITDAVLTHSVSVHPLQSF